MLQQAYKACFAVIEEIASVPAVPRNDRVKLIVLIYSGFFNSLISLRSDRSIDLPEVFFITARRM